MSWFRGPVGLCCWHFVRLPSLVYEALTDPPVLGVDLVERCEICLEKCSCCAPRLLLRGPSSMGGCDEVDLQVPPPLL